MEAKVAPHHCLGLSFSFLELVPDEDQFMSECIVLCLLKSSQLVFFSRMCLPILQASMAADFSVVQFSHIAKLLLWHGRNSYKRTCLISQFIIHRYTFVYRTGKCGILIRCLCICI